MIPLRGTCPPASTSVTCKSMCHSRGWSMTNMHHSPYPEGPTVFAGSANSSRGMRASLPTDIKALSTEQTAALARYRRRWIATRRSTEPADRAAAEEGARLAYYAAGLEPPTHFVWCGGPVELFELTRRHTRSDGANVRPIIVDEIRQRVAWNVRRRVSRQVRAVAAAVIDAPDALAASAADAV